MSVLPVFFAIWRLLHCRARFSSYTFAMSQTDPNKPEVLSHIIEEVMDDCIRVFVLKGLQACSMEDFYEACGPHRAYVEEHFTTKQDFCAAVLLWWLNSIFAELKSTISLHSNLHSAIEAVLYEFIDICVGHRESKHGDKFCVLDNMALFDEELLAKFAMYYQEGVKHFRLKFMDLKSELKDPDDIEKLLIFYVMILEGLYVLIRRGFSRNMLFEYADMSLHTLEFYEKRPSDKTTD
ncbi:TetR/AcrR family transcriptional regulator [Pseudovibrio sp. Alg231-02]|uniref:TetR/AcrR family transcriptional regulator n=1 Tax=Pseudovibrio sp. Alg231-02 TaxID=1922223 RepID=UPI001AD8CBE2|nr:TetR/AcrR family transcriptional regulator [Pseudovibrio sp. Alg231-02]